MPEEFVFLAHIGHWACEVGVQYHSQAIALGSLYLSRVPCLLLFLFFVFVFVFGDSVSILFLLVTNAAASTPHHLVDLACHFPLLRCVLTSLCGTLGLLCYVESYAHTQWTDHGFNTMDAWVPLLPKFAGFIHSRKKVCRFTTHTCLAM